MRFIDRQYLAFDAITRYPMRTSMLLVATAIGVASVLLLTSLGEGARRYVSSEFLAIGTHLLIVTPGKLEASGAGIAGALGASHRDLTLDDVKAMKRSRHIDKLSPVVPGQAAGSVGSLERDITISGVTAAAAEISGWKIALGRFIPKLDLDTDTPVCTIGNTVSKELFFNRSPLGEWLELGDARCRVIGVIAPTGIAGGQDIDETVFVTIAFAMKLFNTERVFRVLVQATSSQSIPYARRDIETIIKKRHHGRNDVTVISQDAVLQSFNEIFGSITALLGATAAVSLIVSGTLIMNVMLVAVSQRTAEIGLMKSLGAKRSQITSLFLTEAAMLSFFGATIGVVLGQVAIWMVRTFYPSVDFVAPNWAIIMAVFTAIFCGLLFGIMPAKRAADLDPVQALASH